MELFSHMQNGGYHYVDSGFASSNIKERAEEALEFTENFLTSSTEKLCIKLRI